MAAQLDLFSVMPAPPRRAAGEAYKGFREPRPRMVKDSVSSSWHLELRPKRLLSPERRRGRLARTAPEWRARDCLITGNDAAAGTTTAVSPRAPRAPYLGAPRPGGGGRAAASPPDADAGAYVPVLSPQYGKVRIPAASLLRDERAAAARRKSHGPAPPGRNNIVLGALPPLPPPPRTTPRKPEAAKGGWFRPAGGDLAEVMRDVDLFERRLEEKHSQEKKPTSILSQARAVRAAGRLAQSRSAQLAKLRGNYLFALLRATTLADIRLAYLSQQGPDAPALDEPAMGSLIRFLVPDYPLSNQQLTDIFRIFDSDQSGKVSYPEFFGTIGAILTEADVDRCIRFFWTQFETPRGDLPVAKASARNIESFARRCLPQALALRWIHLAQELERALQDDPPPGGRLATVHDLQAVVFASPILIDCFRGLQPPWPPPPPQGGAASPASPASPRAPPPA